MEIKKSPKANLEDKKLTSYLIGYILILAVIFVAFEWTQSEVKVNVLAQNQDAAFEDEVVPFTMQNLPPPPPPPPPQAQDIIQLVEEDKEIEEVEIQDVEIDEETKIDVRQFDPNAEYSDGGGEVDEVIQFSVMEDPPKFPGGDKALMEWIGKNLKYPQKAKNRGDKGRVMVSFIIDKDGSVTNAKVLKGVTPELDEEALRVINMMPKWTPGKQRGKAVKVEYQMPITFRLVS